MSNEDTLKSLGKIIPPEASAERDAVHIAVAPMIADTVLNAGDSYKGIGVVDPFLETPVFKGQRFWLFLKPGSITSLRHEWTHPDLPNELPNDPSLHEKWMREWAVQHMNYSWDGELNEDGAYAQAIRAGYELNVWCCEDARDHIDNEWWAHWEAITGSRGQREAYFSCAC